ncbi:MAG: hypothetical protein V4685_17485 [Bacteroidota bacterium]
MKKFLLSLCILFCSFPSSWAQKNEEATIKNVLEIQRLAWHKGNLEEYMQAYWQNDSLMFIGKSGITYGWKQTLENYKKNYPDNCNG